MMPPDLSLPAIPTYYNTTELPDSPKPPSPQWRGVMIALPEEAALTRKQPVLILRGTFRLSGDGYPKNDRLKIVAVNIQTKQEYSGRPGQEDPNPVAPRPKSPPPDPAVLKRMVFSGYFNTDLMSALKLPWAAATYRVHALIGDIRSNELTVKIAIQ